MGKYTDHTLAERQDKRAEEWTDSFGKQIADGTRNNLDVASHYNFSPERLRLFRNGSREFPQYNAVSQFSEGEDVWLLQPDAGDSMHIESAESITYVVNYMLQASWAFELNQALSSGDVLRLGPYNGENGWYMEQRGADHTSTQVDIIQERGGVETTLASDVELTKPTTGWYRYECAYAWYNVMNQIWKQTTTNNGEAENETLVKTSNNGERGPETGNLNLWIEIEADAGTTGLELAVGSMGAISLGDPTSLNRNKPQLEQITVNGTANAWEPILALRIDPDNANVNVQFSKLDILDYSANDDLELVVASFDETKTDATGWGVPEYHHDFNSAVQSTTNVSQVPNNSGTQTDLGAGEKYGGYTIASAADIDGGNVSGSSATANQNRQEKKAVLKSDHVVFLARTDTLGSVLSFVWDVDQNW